MITIGHSCVGSCICEYVDEGEGKVVLNPECPVTGPACHEICRAVSFSQDGKRVVSGVWEQRVTIWDTDTGAEVSSFEGGSCHSGKLDMIRKEAGLLCRTSSIVRLKQEFEEPKGPQERGGEGAYFAGVSRMPCVGSGLSGGVLGRFARWRVSGVRCSRRSASRSLLTGSVSRAVRMKRRSGTRRPDIWDADTCRSGTRRPEPR